MRFYFNILFLISAISVASAQTTDSREYQVKAAFLFNFTQFVEWPSGAFPSPNAPFVIGILGDDPFGNNLLEIVEGEKVNGHPIVVEHFKSADDAKACHILFVNLSETNKMEEALANLKGKSILTVGETGNFIKQGGIIRFFTRDNKIQIQINPDAAKAGNLTVSSKLLRVAEIVVPK